MGSLFTEGKCTDERTQKNMDSNLHGQEITQLQEKVLVIGYWIGWAGVLTGLLVAPPQLLKIIRTGKTDGISIVTYWALVFALLFYLIHAIYIGSLVFVVAQAINLLTNGVILIMLLRRTK